MLKEKKPLPIIHSKLWSISCEGRPPRRSAASEMRRASGRGDVWDQGDPICLKHCAAVWAPQLDSVRVHGLKQSHGFPPANKRQHLKVSSGRSRRHHRETPRCFPSRERKGRQRSTASHQRKTRVEDEAQADDGNRTLWDLSFPSLQGHQRSGRDWRDSVWGSTPAGQMLPRTGRWTQLIQLKPDFSCTLHHSQLPSLHAGYVFILFSVISSQELNLKPNRPKSRPWMKTWRPWGPDPTEPSWCCQVWDPNLSSATPK